MRTHLGTIVAVLAIATLLAVSGAATAQTPNPADDLGASENDVRDEPNHPDDANNIQDVNPFFSPKTDTLILDGYAEARLGHDAGVTQDEDLSNIANFLMHGENTNSYEQFILPGRTMWEAYWGWWSDTGSGGPLQANAATASQFGDPNGAIDDADDCSDTTWDEFTWRGPNNPCASDKGYSTHEDAMYGFVQPGTHVMHVNTMVVGCSCPDDATLANGSDQWFQPDFRYQNNDEAAGQEWVNGNGFARYTYDQSLVMSTQVVTSVNPLELDKDLSGEEYDPYTGSGSATHAHDADIYSSLHPTAEDAYRAAVWDPPQDYGDDEDEQNVFADVHESGLKGFAKYPAHQTYQDAPDETNQLVADTVEPHQRTTGTADDLVTGPYQHEPNTADDDYTVDTDGDGTDDTTLASHDPATSYGGLDGDYYQPGPNQKYTAYQEGEHFWVDAQVGVNDCPLFIPSGAAPGEEGLNCYNGWTHLTPEIPSSSAPVESTVQEEDGDNTFGPGILYWGANAGAWYDENGDTWVGDAHSGYSDLSNPFAIPGAPEGRDDAYDGGNDEDPNDYTDDEFRGSINVDYDVKLVPTEDTDGDGTNDWGTTGVYVMGDFHDGNPYSDAAVDLLGDHAQPVGDALRENTPTGHYIMPDDENGQLSRYRTEGPIDMSPIVTPGQTASTGAAFSGVAVVFPAGNLDASFKVVSQATLTDPNIESQHGVNKGDLLKGESVTDVDKYESILGSS